MEETRRHAMTRGHKRPREMRRDGTGRDGTSRAGVRAADGVRTSRHATSRLASAAGSTRRAPATSATPRDDCLSSTSRGCMSSTGCGAGSGSSIGAGARSARGARGGPGAAALAWRRRHSADATDATAADASAPNFCFLPNSCQNPANCGLVLWAVQPGHPNFVHCVVFRASTDQCNSAQCGHRQASTTSTHRTALQLFPPHSRMS